MSSIAFPAFERAQQEHMDLNLSADELYQAVENAIRGPACDSLIQPALHNASDSTTTSRSALANNLPKPSEPLKPKITKRVNARLQLAAALIEADNERILEKAQFWHIYHPPQADDLLRPPPPPEPALASQSAIFAPYRDGANISVKRHVRTWSAATGLSRLLDPHDDGKRPSVDFLGVTLPTEQKARSRSGSSVAGLMGTEPSRSRSNSLFSNTATSVLGRTSKLGSRPASILDPAGDHDAASDANALSEWGVDKFLSKEERERIAAGERSRAQSLAGSTAARSSFEKLDPPTSRKSMDAACAAPEATPVTGRARSEIVGPSTANAPGAGTGNTKLELLAKIKLYRERQENLPPSQWDGPGPTATKDEVVEHIIASAADNKRVSLPHASQKLGDVPDPPAVKELNHENNVQAHPESVSVLHRPRPSSRADSATSSAFLAAPSTNHPVPGTTPTLSSSQDQDVSSTNIPAPLGSESDFLGARVDPQTHDQGQLSSALAPELTSTQSLAISIPQAAEASRNSAEHSIPAEDFNMVGVGSYSRSQSRRNSFLAGPLFNPHGQETGSSAVMEQSTSMPPHAPRAALTETQLPGPSPLGNARVSSRSWNIDPFAEHDLGLGPSPFAAALQAASPSFKNLSEFRTNEQGPSGPAAPPIDFNSLSTRQLQNVARNSTFPSHLGINRDLLAEEDVEAADARLHEDEFGQMPKRKRQSSFDLAALTQDLAQTGGENFEIQLGGGVAPDLSSANWGKPRKKWFRLSMMMDVKGKPQKSKKTAATDGDEGDGESDAEILESATAGMGQPELGNEPTVDLSELYAAEPSANMIADTAPVNQDVADDVDDDYISPPRRGPLRPLGLAARTPKTILMPQPLQGTEFAPKLRLTDAMPALMDNPPAPKRHSLHVPDGFVLHNSRGGLPPMRSLVVHSASGPQPMYAAKAGKKKQEQASVRLKAVEIGRTVQVPAAAPRGIGRRAGVPTTALFRNHLVQHDDEREGWGWEAGTSVDNMFHPDKSDNSDDDDKPLADIKKQSRSAKRAAKRLAKEKRKRKAARRIRRAKREEALKEGKSFREVGVDELSPDEDLDLSSTTSEEEVTETETESDLWASDDDKRWVDDNKPAGKLYGKSLLDIATERNTERKSKARFYGQVQLEDGEMTMLQVDDDNDGAGSQRLGVRDTGAGSILDDGASVAPSVARSFRDKPLGYNDTRERMEAVFGADHIWAREMAKRQEEEAQEAREKAEAEAAAEQHREADAKAKKDRGLFTLTKKNKNKRETALGVLHPSTMNSTASFAGSNGDTPFIAPSQRALAGPEEGQSKSPARSQTPVEPPVIALDLGDGGREADLGQGGRNTSGLLSGEETARQEWLVESDVESARASQDKDSSDDDVPLCQVKKNVASRPVSFAAGLLLSATKSGDGDSSDEELPLAALKEKRIRQSMLLGGGKLDLDFSSAKQGSTLNGSSAMQSASASLTRPGSVRETTNVAHDGVKLPLSQESGSRAQVQEDDDSDEDLPLGQRHPGGDAALVAMRQALENQKRAMKEAKQAERAQKRAAKLARKVSSEQLDADEERRKTNGEVEDAGDNSEDDDSEDDEPLGYVHPQAAIIAEQAALIRQLQQEKEQQQQQQQRTGGPSPSGSGIISPSGIDMRSSMMLNRMSGLPSMGGIGGMGGIGMPDPRLSMMGLPTTGTMMMGIPQMDGLPASSSGLPFGMSMSTPMQMGTPMAMGGASPVAPSSQIGVSGAMSPAMPMMSGTPQIGTPMAPNPLSMMLDPKASSIHSWRTQVPADATATVTPPGGTSTVNSAG